MSDKVERTVDTARIKEQLDARREPMKWMLSHCVHCSMCAESCFLYMANDKDPRYMPSYKVINSLGELYRRKGKVSRQELEKIRDLVWENCALCMRCYCPVGVDVPTMIDFARSICRSQGVQLDYEE
jgi:Fe-S oxidoreductase